MSRIGLGMIGAGQIAVFTSREFRRHPDCQVFAVADPNGDRAAELAAMVQAGHACTEVDELLSRDDIDAVYIAVPNAYHEDVALKALAAGKHVLLDKPFALNADAASNVINAAEAAERTLMLGMNQRFERNVQRAKGLAAAGRFGDVYHVKAFWRRRSVLACSVAASTSGGVVLGMSSTLVKPPASAARVPVDRSSLCVWPGVRRCTCASIKPGSAVIVLPSMPTRDTKKLPHWRKWGSRNRS